MLFQLDIRTMAIVSTLVHLALTGAMVYTMAYRKVYQGFASWTWSHLSWAVAAVLLCLRPLTGDAMFVIFGNAAFLGYILLNMVGYLDYVGAGAAGAGAAGRGRAWRGRATWGVAGLTLACLAYFYFVDPQYSVRVLLFSTCASLIMLRMLAEPLLAPRARRYRVELIYCAIVAVGLVQHLVRIGLVLANPLQREYAGVAGYMDLSFQTVIILDTLFGLGMAFCQISMTSERVEEELAAALAEAKARADTDHLTGCQSRGHFILLAEGALARARRAGTALSLAVMDVDHFKKINDSMGHLAGDEVLRNLVRALRPALRETDPFGRVGGEEFALCMEGASLLEAGKVLARLQERLKVACLLEGRPELRVTVSMGAAQWRPGETLTQLMSRADEALYQAKAAGRDRVQLADGAGEAPRGA